MASASVQAMKPRASKCHTLWFLRLAMIPLLVTFAAACGPNLTATDLPALVGLDTSDFQEGVRQQLRLVYSEVANQPTDASVNGRLGMTLRAYREYEAAEVAFRRARLLAPDDAKWIYYQAESLVRLGRYSAADQALTDFLKEKPQDIPARLQLAELALEADNPELALSQLGALVRNVPDYSHVHMALARAHELNNDAESAVDAWLTALDLGGNFSQGHYALSQLYRRLGDDDKARRHRAKFSQSKIARPAKLDPFIEEAVKLDVSDRPLILAAQTAKVLGDNNRAIRLLEEAIEKNPGNMETRGSLVAAYAASRQFGKALRHVEAGKEYDAEHVEFNLSCARLELHKGNALEAARILREVVRKSPNNAIARAWLGRALDLQGDLSEAGQTYQAAYLVDPQNLTARKFLMAWLLDHGEPVDSVAVLENMTRSETVDVASAYSAIALLQQRLGNYREALKAIDRGIRAANTYEQFKQVNQLKRKRAELIDQSGAS